MLNTAQQPSNQNSQVEARQQPLGSNLQMNPGGMGLSKDSNLGQNQAGRQYYPGQGSYGYGSQGYNYNPSGGIGGYNPSGGIGGYNPYGSGQCNVYTIIDRNIMNLIFCRFLDSPYNQQMGQYGGGSYSNPYSGSGGYYSGYGGGSYYNRPGYQSNPYQQGGGGYYGGYNWNAGQKQHINMFSVFLSSLLALGICFFISI
ncbi:unnamed protein product [Rotaria sp. Silwood1]|nr:unnamed protein product [Rotaria sp. Silwood1]CAF3339069.1 unnamed protein product [Rotaria sp. Silwood1]CAF3342851.1 unnamed protein product [Rotaria sp. Silwood1]CAF3345974.1 unnamed protein product [Rotaria sp. Silwood1]CAF4524467.1 unnamed protein product [Rotaria sp. Silwood1]